MPFAQGRLRSLSAGKMLETFQRLDTRNEFEGTYIEKVILINCKQTKISLNQPSTGSEVVVLRLLVPQKAIKEVVGSKSYLAWTQVFVLYFK